MPTRKEVIMCIIALVIAVGITYPVGVTYHLHPLISMIISGLITLGVLFGEYEIWGDK